MKSILALTIGLLLVATTFQARADSVFILKVTESDKSDFYNEDNPVNDPFGNNPAGAIAPTGFAVDTTTEVFTKYLIINLTTNEVIEAFYWIDDDYAGVPPVKRMSFDGPFNISLFFDSLVPLKTAKTFLWNFQAGMEFRSSTTAPVLGDPDIDGTDTDGDGFIDSYYSKFGSFQVRGVGSPLVCSATLTLQNIPGSIVGKRNETVVEDRDFVTFDFGGGDIETFDPYRSFEKILGTITMSLDVATTKASNNTAIVGTSDLGFSGSLAAGTLQNAEQRVRNLLYAMGYRITVPSAP